jgi:hypothetical protein
MRGVLAGIVPDGKLDRPSGQEAHHQKTAEKPPSAPKYSTEDISSGNGLEHPGRAEQSQRESKNSSEYVRTRRCAELTVHRLGDRRRQPARRARHAFGHHRPARRQTQLHVRSVASGPGGKRHSHRKYRPARQRRYHARQTQYAELSGRAFRPAWCDVFIRHDFLTLAGPVL